MKQLLGATLFTALLGTKASPQEWRKHQNPAGFEIEHPAGWVVETPDERTVLARNRDFSAFVLIEGFVEKKRPAAIWLQGGLRAAFFRNAVIEGVQRLSARPELVVAKVRFQGSRGPARANILAGLSAGAGTLYAMAASVVDFEAQRSSLGRIVRSFRFTAQGKDGAPPGPAIDYVPFQDPREGAFVLDAPRGWKTTGGLFRFASVDVRGTVLTVSPDDQVRVWIGDPQFPTFAEMNQMLAMTGFREGSLYSPGYGVTFLIRRYLPGLQFAEWYVSSVIGSGGLVEILDRRERPDLAQFLMRQAALAGGGFMQAYSSVGEVAFRRQTQSGYCLVGTTRRAAMGVAIWTVEHLFCFTAAEDRLTEADEVLNRMIRSFQLNPQWVAMQQGLTGAVSRIVSQTNQEISRIHSESYWRRQAIEDRIAPKRSDAIRGQVRMQDPTTGETFTLEAGSNYYARLRGSNIVVGSDSGSFPPQLDLKPLVELP